MRICLCIPYVYTHTLCHLGFLGIKMWFILLRPRPPPEAAEDVLHFLQEDLLDAGLVEASRKWLPKGRVLQPVLQHPPWIWAKNKGIKRIHPRLTQRGMWPELSSVQKSVLTCFFSRELIVGSLPVTTFCSKEIRSPKRQDTTGLTWLAAFFCGLKDKKKTCVKSRTAPYLHPFTTCEYAWKHPLPSVYIYSVGPQHQMVNWNLDQANANFNRWKLPGSRTTSRALGYMHSLQQTKIDMENPRFPYINVICSWALQVPGSLRPTILDVDSHL